MSNGFCSRECLFWDGRDVVAVEGEDPQVGQALESTRLDALEIVVADNQRCQITQRGEDSRRNHADLVVAQVPAEKS